MNKEMVCALLNKVIKVDRGGPESRVGMLLAVEDDYLVLLTEKDGVVYYKLEHIKSISLNAKNSEVMNLEIPEDFEFVGGENFTTVLTNLRHEWVKINRGGPESVEGVLEEINEDYIMIILNEEIIRLAMFHIRNISYGLKLEKVKEEKNEPSKEQEDN